MEDVFWAKTAAATRAEGIVHIAATLTLLNGSVVHVSHIPEIEAAGLVEGCGILLDFPRVIARLADVVSISPSYENTLVRSLGDAFKLHLRPGLPLMQHSVSSWRNKYASPVPRNK